MLDIQYVNHIGIRISDKAVSVPFYQGLGFELITDTGFEQGHPIVLRHASGVTLNLLGPSTKDQGVNILMDVADKYSGITHFALQVRSLEATKAFLGEAGIEITGSFTFGAMSAVFIRDPDRNVIELDATVPAEADDTSGYAAHP